MTKRDHERRRYPRASKVDLEASIVAGGRTVACSIESLSAGGIRVVGPLRVTTGEHVRVLLGARGRSSRGLDAKVLRSEPRDGAMCSVALVFHHVTQATQDAIQQLVLRSLEHRPVDAPHVVVLDDEPGIRAALDRELGVLGFEARSVAAPLDLLRCLNDPALEQATVLVDLRLCHEDGANVLTFLSEDYPRIRRVVMSGACLDELERCVTCGWAHALLQKPFSRRDLVRVLRLDPSSTTPAIPGL